MRVLINELSPSKLYIVVWVIAGLTITGFMLLSESSNSLYFAVHATQSERVSAGQSDKPILINGHQTLPLAIYLYIVLPDLYTDFKHRFAHFWYFLDFWGNQPAWQHCIQKYNLSVSLSQFLSDQTRRGE